MNKLQKKIGLVTLSLSCALTAHVAQADVCSVEQNYTGSYTANYTGGSHAGDSYTFGIHFGNSLVGNIINVSYQTSSGVQGEGSGVLDLGTCTAKISYHNTTPNCPGSYRGLYDFKDSMVTWTYNGSDCWGVLNGSGKATAETYE